MLRILKSSALNVFKAPVTYVTYGGGGGGGEGGGGITLLSMTWFLLSHLRRITNILLLNFWFKTRSFPDF